MKFKSFALAPALIIVMILSAAGIGVTYAVKPAALTKLSQSIAGNRQELAVKIANLPSKYLAQGASDDTILIKFKDGVSETDKEKSKNDVNAKTQKKVMGINTEVLNIPTNYKVGEAIDKLKKMETVEYAEPNYLASAQFDPNDSLYSQQWNLQKISAPLAWDDAQGGAGPIAVVDTGVLSTHPDLSGEVIKGYNFVSDNENATDDNGHGTHVSGIISAITNNSAGVASIGFRSNILPIKVLNSAGSGTYADVASGIIYAADNGARVINLSLGGPTSSATLQEAVTYAVNKGSFVVAAAGNSASSTPLYPAACVGALAVSATDSSDNLASFSSYGKNVFAGAPGVNITSTFNDSSYRALSGTSMAAPHFAGLLEMAIAYIGSNNKSVSNSQLLDHLKTTMDKVGSYPYDQNGWNPYYGYGRINASKLIGQIKESPAVTPIPSPTASLTATIAPSAVMSAIRSAAITQTPYTPVPKNGKSKLDFDVEIVGEIDSLTDNPSVVKIKVKNISQNMKLSVDDLVDLFLLSDTEIKSHGDTISASDLKPADKINVKARWSEDKLSATSITVQGKPSDQSTQTPIITQTPGDSSNSGGNNPTSGPSSPDNSNNSSGNNSSNNSNNSENSNRGRSKNK